MTCLNEQERERRSGVDAIVPRSRERRADGGPTGYEQLAPLFAELARLAPDHPRRPSLRHELVVGHLAVARHIARKHAYRGENLDDLEQAAALGLVHAVDRFDPARGVDFLCFAVPTIDGEVLRHYRDRTSTVRLPRRLRELQRDVVVAVHELGQGLGRAPRTAEIALRLDVDRRAVAQALQADHDTRCVSLDEPAREGPSGDGRVRFQAALRQADRRLESVDDRQSLAPLLDALPERERHVVVLRFFDEMTHAEIAERLGIPQSQVARLLARTLRALRRKVVGQTCGTSTSPAVASPTRAAYPPPRGSRHHEPRCQENARAAVRHVTKSVVGR